MDAIAVREAVEAALVNEAGAPSSFLTRFFGMVPEFSDDTCTVRFVAHDFMLNLHGSIHGGLISFVFDVCMGRLIRHLAGPGKTVELKTQFLRAVPQGELVCQARMLKRGKSISFVEASLSDSSGKLLAAATSTWAH
ncbi:MAG TPA: PaaI family thioesterase [Devosia sp.]|nr:PaaI family thioesterase [Devosia sp.]